MMSDEALALVPPYTVAYTLKRYLELAEALIQKANELNAAEDAAGVGNPSSESHSLARWTPRMVEEALWTFARAPEPGAPKSKRGRAAGGAKVGAARGGKRTRKT